MPTPWMRCARPSAPAAASECRLMTCTQSSALRACPGPLARAGGLGGPSGPIGAASAASQFSPSVCGGTPDTPPASLFTAHAPVVCFGRESRRRGTGRHHIIQEQSACFQQAISTAHVRARAAMCSRGLAALRPNAACLLDPFTSVATPLPEGLILPSRIERRSWASARACDRLAVCATRATCVACQRFTERAAASLCASPAPPRSSGDHFP
jgi:hypothetical protein